MRRRICHCLVLTLGFCVQRLHVLLLVLLCAAVPQLALGSRRFDGTSQVSLRMGEHALTDPSGCNLNPNWTCWRTFYRNSWQSSPLPSQAPLPLTQPFLSGSTFVANASALTVLLPATAPFLRGHSYVIEIADVLRNINATGMFNLTSFDLGAGGGGRVWMTPYEASGSMLRTVAAVARGPLASNNLTSPTYSWYNTDNSSVSRIRIVGTRMTTSRVALTFNGNSSAIPPTPTPPPPPPPTPASNQTDPDIDLRRWLGYDAMVESPSPPTKSNVDWTVPRRIGYMANTRDVLDVLQRQMMYSVLNDNLRAPNVDDTGSKIASHNLTAFQCSSEHSNDGDRLACYLHNGDRLQAAWVFYNATYKTAIAYKAYMDKERSSGREPAFPRSSNWSFVPGMAEVALWTQQIMQATWDNQITNTLPTTCYWDSKSSQTNFNCLGMFKTYKSTDGDGNYFDQGVAARIEPVINDIFPILVHFAHLWDSAFLRLSRVRVQAAFRARWSKPDGETFTADIRYRDTWLDKMYVGTSMGSRATSSASLCAAFMLRSEQILKDRKQWDPLTDPVTVTDVENGRFTNEFLLSASKNVSEGFLKLHQAYGLIEFQTDYTQQDTWGMDMLPVIMTYVCRLHSRWAEEIEHFRTHAINLSRSLVHVL